MAFVKRDVKDRVVQYPRRYQMVEVQPGIFDLIPVSGTVTEEGTPINKAYLQPIEDGLAAALEKTGDGKDVIVTFAEAATEALIVSGEKLSVLFGKILKKFKNVAPLKHDSSANTYGLGTTANYGHVKTINALTQISHADGTALSAYQGKVLNDKKIEKPVLIRSISPALSFVNSDQIIFNIADDLSIYDFIIFELDGNVTYKSGGTSTQYNGNVRLKGANTTIYSLFTLPASTSNKTIIYDKYRLFLRKTNKTDINNFYENMSLPMGIECSVNMSPNAVTIISNSLTIKIYGGIFV